MKTGIKNPSTAEGQSQAREAATVLIEMARLRWPYFPSAVEAVEGLLSLIVLAITGDRTVPYPSAQRGRLGGEGAAMGSILDQVFVLEAEDRYRQHLHIDGICSARSGELRFRAKPGATSVREPRSMDVQCPVHGTKPGEQCPGMRRRGNAS